MDIETLVKRIIDVREAYVAESRKIQDTHSAWHDERDARSTLLTNECSALMNATAGMITAAGYMLHPTWWKHHFKVDVPPRICMNYAERHADYTKFAFVMVFFAGIDAGLRQITRAVHPGKFANATIPIGMIYKEVFKSFGLEQYVAPLDVLREIRNLAHNNGVYVNKDARDCEVTYRGSTYTFVHMDVVDFASWELVLDIVEDVLGMSVEFVTHPDIAAIDSIKDPRNALST